MGLRISTNVASIAAQRHLGNSQRIVEKSMKQLASGDRFSDPSEGAGEFAVAEHLRGQISGLKASRNNADFANSFISVGEGGLNEQNNILVRLRELSIQAASDTFSDKERGFLNLEAKQLVEEFDRIAKTTSFGSQRLLMGDGKEYVFQIGAYKGPENIIKYTSDTNTTSGEVGIDSVDLADKDDALDSLESIDEALVKIGEARARFASIQSRLTSISNNAGVQIENLTAAHSRIADADIASAISEMTRNQILQQFQTAVLSQANQTPNSVLKLLS
jgi:flagellin